MKDQIINIFNEKIRDQEIILEKKYHGSEGHWLEKKFGIIPNSVNKPDIFGYELKKDSKKITFGDYSASEYLFSKTKNYIDTYNNCNIQISRDNFIRNFGTQNPKKNNRYSWSGICVPKYNIWNDFGQILEINDNNDICIYYCYNYDKRQNQKYNFLLEGKKLIAYWKKEKLENHINNKFNQNGFIICKKENNKYNKICFGKSFCYKDFLIGIKNGNIIFDSGMYLTNFRNYSNFRSNNKDFWYNLIIEEY